MSFSIETTNDELVSRRALARDYAGHIARLLAGDVEKLVLMERGQMQAVVIPIETYEGLLEKKSKG